MRQYKRTLITTALPYANGPLHIGHLSGAYLPADILARYLRLKGEEVLLIGGSDEHGVPVTLRARSEGTTPQEVVDRYHEMNKKAFEEFGISFDIYSRTTSPKHYEVASEFFRSLYEKGAFIEQETEQYYDPKAEQFLADRYLSGTCPKCQYEKAYGDQCEHCGASLSPTDLVDPLSVLTGETPVRRKTKHWYLPLDQYEKFFREWLLEGHKEWKANVYGQCKSWIEGGLQPRAVSRDLDWGVPVPIEGAEGKVLYVWFDAPIGYISATQELTDEWEMYWKSPDSRLIHFIGKDNIVFHCLIFPAMLKAYGGYNLPDNVPANEFMNLENDKISTSRNWGVWLHEYLEEFPERQDVLKYVLIANMPETKDSEFTWKDYQVRTNNELVAVLGNFVNRVLVLTHKYYQGVVPTVALNEQDEQILCGLLLLKKEMERKIEDFHFREGLKLMMDMARLGNKYLTESEPWKLQKGQPERAAAVIYVCLQVAASLAIAAAPFLPDTSQKLCRLLNLSAISWQQLGEVALVPSQDTVGAPELLFEKVEDGVVKQQIDKLHNSL